MVFIERMQDNFIGFVSKDTDMIDKRLIKIDKLDQIEATGIENSFPKFLSKNYSLSMMQIS